MFAAAALGSVALAPTGGSAAPVAVAAVAQGGAVHTVQYWGAGPQPWDDGWERRREWRQQRDEARIAEAARREAWRIEQEREQQYGGYGAGYDYQRGW
jgi:hypothetical protein